jgi:hypothetical protein
VFVSGARQVARAIALGMNDQPQYTVMYRQLGRSSIYLHPTSSKCHASLALAISGDDIIAMLKVIIIKHQKSLDFGAIAALRRQSAHEDEP